MANLGWSKVGFWPFLGILVIFDRLRSWNFRTRSWFFRLVKNRPGRQNKFYFAFSVDFWPIWKIKVASWSFMIGIDRIWSFWSKWSFWQFGQFWPNLVKMTKRVFSRGFLRSGHLAGPGQNLLRDIVLARFDQFGHFWSFGQKWPKLGHFWSRLGIPDQVGFRAFLSSKIARILGNVVFWGKRVKMAQKQHIGNFQI